MAGPASFIQVLPAHIAKQSLIPRGQRTTSISGKVEAMAEPTPEKIVATETRTIAESIAIMARLRGPGGCPWDREQTFDTIKRHTLEETYEVFDAIERRAWPDLKDCLL